MFWTLLDQWDRALTRFEKYNRYAGVPDPLKFARRSQYKRFRDI